MKHFLLTAAAAAMVLALGSCAKTEVTDVPDSRYIGFDNAYIGNPTKAIAEISNATINHFMVFGGYQAGSSIFNNGTAQEVAPNSNGEWTYSPLVPWVDEQTYKFYAYAPKTIQGTPSYDYTNGISFDGFVVDGLTNQLDFVYAASGDVSSGSEGSVRPKVQFTFGHMLSMIQFTIKSGFPEDVKLNISDFKFYGMNSTCNFDNGSWGSSSEAIQENTPINLSDGFAQATETPADYADNCVVLPQTFSADVVCAKFTINVPVSTSIKTAIENKVITAKIPADTWEPGYRYNYIVTIDGQTLDFITFDAPKVNTWEDYENINMVNDDETPGQVVGGN